MHCCVLGWTDLTRVPWLAHHPVCVSIVYIGSVLEILLPFSILRKQADLNTSILWYKPFWWMLEFWRVENFHAGMENMKSLWMSEQGTLGPPSNIWGRKWAWSAIIIGLVCMMRLVLKHNWYREPCWLKIGLNRWRLIGQVSLLGQNDLDLCEM